MGLSAALSRWRVGVLADRYGAQRFLAAPDPPHRGRRWRSCRGRVASSDGVRVVSFLVAMLLIGLCYGALQNLTLLISFAAVSRRHHNRASAVWNIGFDAGTALGSVAVGVIAEVTSFATAILARVGSRWRRCRSRCSGRPPPRRPHGRPGPLTSAEAVDVQSPACPPAPGPPARPSSPPPASGPVPGPATTPVTSTAPTARRRRGPASASSRRRSTRPAWSRPSPGWRRRPAATATSWSTSPTEAPELTGAPLRAYLNRLGYDARGWGFGTNTGDPRRDVERLSRRVLELVDEKGEPASLVGWSLGGVIAREVARRHPDAVRRVVTYGTPVAGGARHTSVARSSNAGADAHADRVARRLDASSPIRVPLTVLFSRRDGVVSWQACIDRATPAARMSRCRRRTSGWGSTRT